MYHLKQGQHSNTYLFWKGKAFQNMTFLYLLFQLKFSSVPLRFFKQNQPLYKTFKKNNTFKKKASQFYLNQIDIDLQKKIMNMLAIFCAVLPYFLSMNQLMKISLILCNGITNFKMPPYELISTIKTYFLSIFQKKY